MRDRQRIVPIVLAQLVGLACGVLGVRVVSHLVTPAALGAYGVFLTFTTLGSWVIYSGLTKFVGRHWAAGNQPALWTVIARAWRRKLGWLLAGAGLAAAAIQGVAPLPFAFTTAAIFTAAAALSVAALGQSALQAARHNWPDLAASSLGSVTRTFLPPLAFTAFGLAGLYAGFLGHAVLFAAAALIAVARTRRPADSGNVATVEPVYDGTLFTVLAVIGWILASENRWLAMTFWGDVTAGHFTLASNIALIIPSMLGSMLLQLFQPGFYRLGDQATPMARRELSGTVDRTAAGFTAIALLGIVVLRLIAPALIGPLIDTRYRASVEWLVPAGCFGIATTLAGFYHTLLLASRRERGCGPVDISTAAILSVGAVASAVIGSRAFQAWLILTPAIPWVVTRTLAKRYLATPAPDPARGPAP